MSETMLMPEKNENSTSDVKQSMVLKINRKMLIGGLVLAAVLVAAFYFKGLFVAATVGGSPISRMSVIKQLEKQGGKNVLEGLISQKLIENAISKSGVTVSEEEITAEIDKIGANITAQGGSLQDVLAMQGMTEEDLKKQIKVQKSVEKILSDKLTVTDDEVKTYITQNTIALTKGKEVEMKAQIMEKLRRDKLNAEASKWIETLRQESDINYYVNY